MLRSDSFPWRCLGRYCQLSLLFRDDHPPSIHTDFLQTEQYRNLPVFSSLPSAFLWWLHHYHQKKKIPEKVTEFNTWDSGCWTVPWAFSVSTWKPNHFWEQREQFWNNETEEIIPWNMGTALRHGHSGALPRQLVSFAKSALLPPWQLSLPSRVVLASDSFQLSLLALQHPQEQRCITWSQSSSIFSTPRTLLQILTSMQFCRHLVSMDFVSGILPRFLKDKAE